ncbi:FtsX-like permease family protein [Corynebacterium gerontici]|uniref:Outer membrane-specific lipoprotein transporter subunit LolE n=1 Tax=Corynebacterium gerontici TaxID=2079234 RepID=A0A3G6IZ89_9CORY|nr:FtsX-like permease family protein [Corynebacterium gerontici]AZA11007.1 outer membrane-specific lipoprotein transporter subunit LolE [Corynebacterium gerontici]
MSALNTMRAALRPTLRDIRRHWWRSILAVLLVALPVGLYSYGVSDNATRTQAAQSLELRNKASYFGKPCEQNIYGWAADCQGAQSQGAGPEDEMQAALPDGFRADLAASITVRLENPGEHSTPPVSTSLQLRDPETLSFGDATPGEGEIVIGLSDAERLGIGVGDQVTVTVTDEDSGFDDRRENLTVSGVIGASSSVARPGTLLSEQEIQSLPDSYWVLSGTRAMRWQDVKDLNAQGYVVESQDVADNPPPREELYPQFSDADANNGLYETDEFFLLISASVLAIAGLLILLCIAPVFSISAAQRGEAFALMRSQGATRRHIRIAVLGYGLVAGIIGATGGLVVGASVCAIVWKSRLPEAAIALPWKELLFGFVLAIVGALLASYLPAWLASHNNISQAASGGRVDRMRRWSSWMAIGPVFTAMILLGAGLLTSGVFFPPERFAFFAAGPLAVLALLVSIVLSVPAMILACSALRRPLMVRLSATLMRRQMLRSASALAAVAGVTLVASLLVQGENLIRAKQVDLNSRTYNTSVLSLESFNDETSADAPAFGEAREVLEQHLAIRNSVEVEIPERDYDLTPDPADVSIERCGETGSAEVQAHCPLSVNMEPSVNFVLSTPSSMFIAEPTIIDAFRLSPEDRKKAQDAMRSGAVLVSRAYAEFHPSVLHEYSYDDDEEWFIDAQIAALLPEDSREILMTEATAKKLGIKAQNAAELLFAEHQPSDDEISRVREALSKVDPSASVGSYPSPRSVHDSMVMSASIALGLLIIVAITHVLGLKDLRRMQEQLANIGASSKQLRLLAATSTGLLAALGTWVPLAVAYAMSWLNATPASRDANGMIYDYGTRAWVGIDPVYTGFIALLVPLVAFTIGAVSSWKPKPPGYRMD